MNLIEGAYTRNEHRGDGRGARREVGRGCVYHVEHNEADE